MTETEQNKEEWVPEDDAVIGRALKVSGIVVLLIVVLVAAVLLLGGEEASPEVVREKDAGAIPDLAVEAEVLPDVRFTDITREAGIDFVHFNGARGEKLLPETMGGGVAFFDYDGDGDQDLLFANGASWPHDPDRQAPGNRLYANDGKGNFSDVTATAGLTGDFHAMGIAVGDYDGDGRVDVLFTGVGGNRLFRNTPEGFVDVTDAAGVAGDENAWTTSAAFLDYDGDGDLDAFVCHYVEWSRSIDEQLAFTLNGIDRAYGPPMNYSGTFSTLYRNEGDGTFSDVSAEAGIQVVNSATGAPMGKALGVSFADFDGDGHEDIVVANDTVQNHLFHNQGDGTFEEIGFHCGIGFDTNGNATGAMGIDVADYRDDGGLAVGIANFANEMSSLYCARDGRLSFSDDAIGEGLGSPSRQKLSFGFFFFDYDLDGRQDLLQVNGHLEETIHEVQESQHYLQSPQLFWNAGPDARSCYQVVPDDTLGDLALEIAGRGSAYADVDGDGDLDIAMAQVGSTPKLLRNDQSLGRHWLRVRLGQDGANPNAIGAWIELDSSGRTMRRQVTPTKSYLSQSELAITFGLGESPAVDALRVTWPDGEVQEVPAPDTVDRELVIRRP